jgi:hypothetical protein
MGNYLIRVGNYVSASPSELGNFVIVRRQVTRGGDPAFCNKDLQSG